MIELTSDPVSERLRFGSPPNRRLCGLGIALIVPAVALLISRFGIVIPPFVLWALGGAALLAGYWIAFDTAGAEIVPGLGVYRRSRGPWPITRHRDTPLAKFDRLAFEVTRQTDVYGEERPIRSLYLEGESGRAALFRCNSDPGVAKTVEKVAAALGWPVPAEVAVDARRRPLVQRAVTVGSWAVMVGLAVALVWPAQTQPQRNRVATLSMPPTLRRGVDVPTYYEQGIQSYARSRFAESEKRLRLALKDSPGSPEVLNMLAYAVAEQGRLDEALQVAQKALKADRENWMILDTVAEMHQRRKEWSTAATYYERALRATPGGGVNETQCKYGETLLELGRKPDAIKQLLRATAGSEPQWAVRARKVLAELGVKVPQRRDFGPVEAPISGVARPMGRQPTSQ